jgi:hypothetical protein
MVKYKTPHSHTKAHFIAHANFLRKLQATALLIAHAAHVKKV